jgi:hypothetical protein
MKKKLSSYQKLKKRIEGLHYCIRSVVREGLGYQDVITAAKEAMRGDMRKSMWPKNKTEYFNDLPYLNQGKAIKKGKLNSYQKLKAEILRLKGDLYTICLHPESKAAISLKVQWQMYFDTEEAIWFGDSENKGDGKMGGIIPFIQCRTELKIKDPNNCFPHEGPVIFN